VGDARLEEVRLEPLEWQLQPRSFADETKNGFHNAVGEIHPDFAEPLDERTGGWNLAHTLCSEDQPEGADHGNPKHFRTAPAGPIVENHDAARMKNSPGED